MVVAHQMADKGSLEHRISQQTLKLGVLILQRFKAVRVRNDHSRDIAAQYPAAQ
jgi:hypothetical protein